LMATHSC